MHILYVAPRYHTNQIPIMEGWLAHGDEVLFLVQYMGKSEDYSVLQPVVLGYGPLYRAFERVYLLVKRKQENSMDLRLKYGSPALGKLRRLMRKFRPDVVITRERSLYSIAVTFLCRFFDYPVILYNQSPLWEENRKDDLPHRIVRRLTPKYRITPVLTLGRGTEGKTKEEYAYYLPFLMEPHLAPQEREYFARERINLFAIGKYQKRKNHKMLVEAVEELCRSYPVHLQIAGEVSNSFHEAYYQELSAYIQEHQLQDVVELKVNLKREEIFEIYKKTDLFVLASTGEPAAVSHLEAMSFSIPVISGEDNGTACYVEDGVNGYICRDNDKKDLREKMEAVISDRERLKTMGAESYRLVLERHQFSGYYEKIMEILARIEREK
ncbi:MAG TPA: glycosyltransferase family 4 protein [Candidatus Eisenbergiella merdipullorum]|uniref:Glycosyltransferase family 4 protein n=1 Tax=Candidatus Eisenbergiella merdipullorum TaxID=2838553 RepID=A0A9D2I8K4_9FIRM|nr:glycosyltransferase family 4 protein [Candidatus Eisenbergiella merdipullorum]